MVQLQHVRITCVQVQHVRITVVHSQTMLGLLYIWVIRLCVLQLCGSSLQLT
jgi:hypothetical protein